VVRHLQDINREVSPILSLVIYRVAQEAMTNAVRHAPGSLIELELAQFDASIRLRVLDRGRGIAENPPDGGIGIRSMAERALLVGGTLEVDSSPAGTMVTLIAPLASSP
jgi:signal transduction histidine kinase